MTIINWILNNLSLVLGGGTILAIFAIREYILKLQEQNERLKVDKSRAELETKMAESQERITNGKEKAESAVGDFVDAVIKYRKNKQ